MRRFFNLPWRTRQQIRADVDDELSFHLDMRIDALVATGLSPDQARAQAIREFGDIDDARRYIRAVDHDIEAARRRSDYMNDLRSDVIYAVRKLRGSPMFTLTAVLTLALGIGANTAIFSVVNGVLLKPLPFPQQDNLVRIQFRQQGHGDASTPPDLADFRTRSRAFEGFAHYEGLTANLVREHAEPERIAGGQVSANWFSLLRVRPLHGRFFAEGEDTPSAPRVVVLSEALWRRDFAADPAIVGKQLQINAQLVTVVGIAPDGQGYPMRAELWTPLRFTTRDLGDATRGARWLGLLGRVKEGVPFETARAEVEQIEKQMEGLFPEQFRERRAQAIRLQTAIVGDLQRPLYVIMAAVAVVLLIACANVANLMLIRATARESEMAIRTALGAGRSRLVRQLITESMILSAVGAVVGVAFAKWGMNLLIAMAPDDLPRVKTAAIDATALVVTAGAALIIGLLFGVFPAMQTAAGDLANALRAGARGTRTRRQTNRTKRLIVAAEVALAVTLLTGAGLLIRSFRELMTVDPGFQPDHIMTMRVLLPEKTYDTVTKITAFSRQLEARALALPGVRAAALGSAVPLDGTSFWLTFTVRGRAPVRKSDEPSSSIRLITPGYFTVLGTPLLRGRAFAADDRAGAPRVAIVNQTFAKKFMPNEDPIGRYVDIGWTQDGVRQGGQIVGIVGDMRDGELQSDAEPTFYLPFDQTPTEGIAIAIRTATPPASAATALRGIVRDLDPTLPVYQIHTMEEQVAASVSRQRFYATLLGVFASVALVLAAVGLYGVIAYAVSQRTHELGVRVALGATGDRISRMVIAEGVILTAIGVLVGLAASLEGGRLITKLLYNVKASDPVTFVGVALLLGVVAACASYIPARRAARVDPLVAMRGD
ncbi:MAG TPA: ABC transporter permease [Gemmatimonadaceae bacterium]|nr:ABC transporter permease [Gemmatimonadaceae bacterium]